MADTEGTLYDVIIIGAGPAGLTAAIYTARARLKSLVMEDPSISSQAGITYRVENYPGFPEGINGFDLMDNFKRQAVGSGAELCCAKAGSITTGKDGGVEIYRIDTDSGGYRARAVIIATGGRSKGLGAPGEEKFRGRGISYCATCDGPLFKDKVVVVVGGGNTACEEATFLAKFASKIYMVHRRDDLRAIKILQERVLANSKIEVLWDSVITEIKGDNRVRSVSVRKKGEDNDRDLACDGVFIFVGVMPNTAFVKDIVNLDGNSYIITDDRMRTSRRGIFACGDCRNTYLWQIVTAAGDGALAAHSAQNYIENLKGN